MNIPARAFVLVAVALAASPATARMYQWLSPASGSMQLSGEPPAWYRSGRDAPRVWVFQNGSLIDDTAIALPRAQREELRETAFEESEQRRRAEALKRLERAARREQRRQEELERLAAAEREREAQVSRDAAAARGETAPDEPAAGGSRVPPAAAGDAPLDDATVERLKAIIREFDRSGGG